MCAECAVCAHIRVLCKHACFCVYVRAYVRCVCAAVHCVFVCACRCALSACMCVCARVIFTPRNAYGWHLQSNLALPRGLFSPPSSAAGCWAQGESSARSASEGHLGGWGQVDPRGPGKLERGSGARAPGSVPCSRFRNRRVLSLASGVSAVAPSSILRVTRANAATWWRIGDTAGSHAADAPFPRAGGWESSRLLSRRPGGGGGKAGRLTSRHPLSQAVRPAALSPEDRAATQCGTTTLSSRCQPSAIGALLPRPGVGAEKPRGSRGGTPRTPAGHLAGGRAGPGASPTSCPAPARRAVPGPSFSCVPVACVPPRCELSG